MNPFEVPAYLAVPDSDSVPIGTNTPKTKTAIIADLPSHRKTTTKPPATNAAVYRLDFFDILNKAQSELSALATNAGIDWQKLQPQITTAQNRYTKNIALDKKHAGKVCAFIDCKTAKNGQQFPFITFYTQKHGGESFVFNGYEWLKENGLIHAKPLSNAEKIQLEKKRAERDAEQAKKAERAKQREHAEKRQAIATLENTKKRFIQLPKPNQDSFKSSYLDGKGFSLADIPHSLKLRFDSDKTGKYLIYPIKRIDSTGKLKTINFQKIYTDNRKLFLTGNETGGGFSLLSHETKLDKEKTVFLAEGLSTGLSSFIADGKPVFLGMYASNLVKVATDLKAAGFKKVITLADNDPTGIKAALDVQKTCGYPFILPELENVEKCDFDDIRQAKGIAFLKDFIHQKTESLILIKKPVNKILLEKSYFSDKQNALFNQWNDYIKFTEYNFSTESKPHYPAKDYLTAHQASEKLQDLTDSFFKNLNQHLIIKASAGSGKTRAAVNSLANIAINGQVHVFAPTHKLSSEWHQNLLKENPALKVRNQHGRGSSNNAGHLCEKYEQVKQVQDLKIPVYPAMCSNGKAKCEHFENCQYIKQFQDNTDIVLMPHSYLALNHAELEKKPAAVVIDERFFNVLISSNSYPQEKILSFTSWGNFRFKLLEAIDLVKQGKGLFQALKDVTGLDSTGLLNEIESIISHLNGLNNDKSTLGIFPGMTKNEFDKKLNAILPVNEQITLLLPLYKELSLYPERTESSFFRIEGNFYTLNNRHLDNRFNYYLNNNIPILVIDADANKSILSEIFRIIDDNPHKDYLLTQFEEIAVKRNAKAIQYKKSQFAKNRLFTGNNPNIKEIERAAAIIQKIAGDEKTLIITYKKLSEYWLINEKLTEKYPNLAFLHFGDIRGIDAYKDFERVIILGRNQPKATAMENAAAALFAYDKEPIQFSGGYEKTFRQYRSETVNGKAVDCHKDDRVQALLEQFRECETLQAIDRLRFIHNSNAKREIHILNDLALDIDIAEFRDVSELLPRQNKLLDVFKLHNGILPLSPSLLLSLHPEHFENLDQAKNLTRETELIKCKNDIKSLYIGNLHLIRYRVKGERGKHKNAYFIDFYSKNEVLDVLKQWHDDKELEFISIEKTEQNLKPVLSFAVHNPLPLFLMPQTAVIPQFQDVVFNPLPVEKPILIEKTGFSGYDVVLKPDEQVKAYALVTYQAVIYSKNFDV